MRFHAYVPSYFYHLILKLLGTFLIISLSLPLTLVAPWHLNISLLHPRTLFVLRHLLLLLHLTPFPLMSDSVMKRPNRTSWRTFHDATFIQNAKVILLDFFDTDLPTVIHSRGWESLCGVPVTCPFVIIQDFYSNMHGFDYSIPQFVTCVRGMRIVVTPDLISEVLHAPRVAHPDYPGCNRLRTVSKDKLLSLFYEIPLSWGDCQNTPCLAFAKGPRFLNMVMTFILHPLSHYNTITEPRARFLLSLLKDISIDFPSHFILSLIDVYRDTAARDKLIFILPITWIIRHYFISYPKSNHFSIIGAIDAAIVRRSDAQLRLRRTQT